MGHMTRHPSLRQPLTLVLSVFGAATCFVWIGGGQAEPSAPIAISGSSTVGPITELAIRSFQNRGPGRTAQIAPVVENGTSAGFRDFCSGKTAINNASRPISGKELSACKAAGVAFYELPIGFDAITLVVNTNNTWARDITLGELKTLWSRSAQNKVNRWDQVRSGWPNQPIRLFGPGRDSGTFDYFSKAITGEVGNQRGDISTSEDDNQLVKRVEGTPYAMGYFGYAYFRTNSQRLRALAVVGPKGKVLPSLKTVQNETYQPLSRPVFIYVNARRMETNPTLRSLVNHYIMNASEFVGEEGSVPLSDSQYRLVQNKLFRHVLGTAFGGDLPVGLTLGQILNRSIDQTKRPQFRL